ncbi:hypothetical protein I5K50_10220 [Pseudomonas aeruginosa]|nr:hypothetical protein [Pseudomonas aeruginosa]MBH9228373.1 hypothetical protein [Pseudomonas aeruginosa]
MNKALDLLREIRPSIPKEVLELWCKDRDAFLASHPAVEQAGGDERAACNLWIAEQQLCQGSDISLFTLERNGALVSLHELLRDAYQAGQARAALAQPSPAQAEAERPEVVARVVHSNPVVLGQCGPLNANDELMTVAQHAASVARWAEMFNRVEQQRDAALARVAGLELGIARIAGDFLPDNSGQAELALDEMRQALHELLAAAPTQAQHSVPEEFSFEYRHPNGESHTVTVSRDQVINEMPDFLFEALCSKFCNCEPVGETNVVECCCDEYAEEFKLLAAAPGNSAQHSVPEGWKLVPIEPLLNMMSDKDHDTRITAERQLLSILAAAPGKEGV